MIPLKKWWMGTAVMLLVFAFGCESGKDAKENPNMIMVQICHSNDRNKIVKGKQAFKKDLYEALDLGGIWLEQVINEDN